MTVGTLRSAAPHQSSVGPTAGRMAHEAPATTLEAGGAGSCVSRVGMHFVEAVLCRCAFLLHSLSSPGVSV